MTTARNQPPVSRYGRSEDQARILDEVRRGQIDCSGEITLAAYTEETVITDRRFSPRTALLLIPLSEDGLLIGWWLAERVGGRITIGHDAPAVDTAFVYIALG